MNYTHLHLLLNHFPVIGTLFATLFLLYGTIRKNREMINGALAAIVAMALVAIPVFLTGEPAEDSVEKIAGVSKSAIEEHEEAAELALWFMELAGALALLSLIFTLMKQSFVALAIRLTWILSIAAFLLMARTGYIGGKIRHTEIDNPAAAATTNGEAKAEDDD